MKKVIKERHVVDADKKSRLLRKFYTKLVVAIAIASGGIYCGFHIGEADYYLLGCLNSIVLFIYFAEGVGRTNKRLNGKWL